MAAMEVVMPYVSAPASPRRFADGEPFDYYCHYASAPTSPRRLAALYVPFDWEETPGTPKEDYFGDDGFAFEFSGRLEQGVLPPELATADELFEEGRIRPLKPTPVKVGTTRERGRERVSGGLIPSPYSTPSASRSRKGSRSLSPIRGEYRGSFMQSPANSPRASTSSTSSSAKSKGGSKKWRLKDLLLFRSASEGRVFGCVTGNRSKDPLRKYTTLPTNNDSKNSSFRSTDGSVGSSMRRGSASPHEIHYKSNRAASEEMKKKTLLPFVRGQGLFGYLRYNPAVQSIARGFHSSSALNRHRRS